MFLFTSFSDHKAILLPINSDEPFHRMDNYMKTERSFAEGKAPLTNYLIDYRSSKGRKRLNTGISSTTCKVTGRVRAAAGGFLMRKAAK